MAVKPKCACGCGQRAANRHHAVYQSKLREIVKRGSRDNRERGRRLSRLGADKRNLVWLAFDCHMAHHDRSRVLPLGVLPDSVFEFAVELLGAGEAFEYLRRRYWGEDARLDALLVEAEAA